MKKWWVLLIIAVAAAFLLEIVQISTQPKVYKPVETAEMKLQETAVFPEAVTGTYGYEITEDGLETTAADPQLYLDTYDSGIISTVSFSFHRPTESDLRIQIFCPDANGDLSEQNSAISNCPAGTEYWTMEIPKTGYAFLRVDIDGTPIPLKAIGVGDMQAPAQAQPVSMHARRIVIVAVLLFAVLLWATWCGVWGSIRKTAVNAVRGIREGKGKSILGAVLFPVIIGAAIFLFWIFCTVIGGKPMTSPRIVFAGLIGLFGACMLIFRKTLKDQPEYLFLVLVLCIGFLFCWYVPHTGLNGWDEDYHYTQALKTSYVDSLVKTPQDELTIARTIPASFDLSGGVDAVHERQDQLYHSGATEIPAFPAVSAIPEIFNGIGLFTGRALGMPYHMIHFMGRFFGLITYAMLGFFAIRKLKSGKMIAAVSLMIPTGLFIASSYNYDCYLTGFTAMGSCYYIAQWQDRQAKLTLKDALIMIGTISFGCLTKPVYIPMLWILVLMPRDKFAERKQHVLFILGLAAATCAVMVSYVLPMFLRNAMTGDVRGGSDVNIGGQISYILHNPLAFIDVMWRYAVNEYFELNRLGEFMTNMAYHGIMPNQYFYLALLTAVAFTDKNEYDRELVHHPWAHIWPMIVSAGLVVAVMASMYIAFTPVGASRVNGAQFRYLIPMVLPVLMHIGSGKVENRMHRGWYNALVLSAAAYAGFACVYNAFIIRYF